MVLEIEYYKGNTTLFGKRLDKCSLRQLLNEAEQICGICGDLAETLCRYYGFDKINANEFPEWVYDRDTRMLYMPKK